MLVAPYCEILSWCLMPNHFHFLIVAKENGCQLINEKHRPNVQILSKNFGTLLSSFTRAINKEIGRKGKLFAHNSTAKCINDQANINNFLETCFHYIHQNPVKAELCSNLSDWEFSSFLDYAGLRNGTLVNQALAYEMLNFDKENFIAQSNSIIDEQKVKCLY